jgi:2-polyprenyl-3-methyl-5-hydroxy-6-metoxy-1,4-benzoquinol methylase
MKKCLLCDKNNNVTIYEFPEHNNKIVKCECGFIYSTITERKDVDKAYLEDYWTTYQINQGEKQIYDRIEEFEFISDERMDFIKKFKESGKLLDVGCSMGFLVNSANKSGFDSYGIDLNKECIEYGIKKYSPIKLYDVSLEDFNENFFDVICSFNVIEHLDNPEVFLEMCYSKLNEDGIIVIGTHDIESNTHKTLGSDWKQITKDGDHLYYFSIDTMERLGLKCGLEKFWVNKPIDPSFTFYFKKIKK